MNKLLFFTILLLPATTVRAADVTPHSLLAHANDQQFWIARIDHPGGSFPDTTTVYYRLVGQDDKWQRLCFMQTRIEQLASQGSLGAAVLSDGSWMLLYTDGSTVTAGPLPASAKMVALAGGKNWWALGEVAGGITAAEAATRQQPGTRPSTATRAATFVPLTTVPALPASGAPRMVLFQLGGNDWMPVAELPEEVIDGMRVSLAVIEDNPYVASFEGDAVRVRHLDGGRWTDDFVAAGLAQTASFKLLGDTAPPRLWVQQQSGPDLLYVASRSNRQPLQLIPLADIPAKDRSVALFGGSLRMIGQAKGKFLEQRFAIDTGRPEGKPTDLGLPASPVLDMQGLQTLIAIGALLLVLLGWFRQQSASAEPAKVLENVTLAPLGRRLLAGLIDVLPVILTMLVFIVRDRRYTSAPMQSRQLMLLIAYWGSGLFYIILTTLIEALGGRSFGKVLLGLRVVSTDAQVPTPGALVIRNVLRLFDVSLFFLPVIIIAFFPLRQRAGDLAAGTLVVMNKGEQKGPDQTS